MTLITAQLTDWENSIFGVSGLAATGDDKNGTKTVSYIVGEFEKYAYGEQYKGQVELGKGLVGAILLDFEKNSQKEKAGWEALDAPTWERKLWCSDTFPGPSIREFSTMVASIAATVCTFGAGAMLAVAVSAAVMAANELTFELADVGVGYHDWDEAAKNVAKAAVSGAISGASGAAMGAASKVGGIGGVFLKTGITSSSSITTQFTNAFIDDGFSGVVDAFNSWSDWQGIAFSTAGSFVTNGLGAMNSFDSTGKLLNGNTFNTGAMSSFNSLAGGLTTNALEFAFTGQTTFNLANLSMLGLEYGSMWGAGGTGTISGGFLSMTIGENGTHFAISSAGTDISLGTLKLAAAGAKESSKVIDWKYGSVETNSTLNSINMLGYTNIGGNQKLSKDIWNEKITVNYTDTGGDYGNYSGGSTINISSTLLGGGAEDYAKLATVLAHEGTHAYGNGIEGVAHSVGLETYTQINQAYDISGDIDFATEMIEAIKNPDSWKENTGDTDHWTVKTYKDGRHEFIDDGDYTKLTVEYWDEDKDGNDQKIRTLKIGKESGGAAEFLGNILGQDRIQELLGKSYTDLTLYDADTLKDVLHISKEQAEALKYAGGNLAEQWELMSGNNLTQNQINALLGEAYLKANGYTYTDKWSGGTVAKNSLTSQETVKGFINFVVKNGDIIGYVVTAELFRNEDSFSGKLMGESEHHGTGDVYDTNIKNYSSNKDEQLHSQKRELDKIIYTLYDLNNNKIDSFGGKLPVQSVDVYNIKDPKDVNRDQPYYSTKYGWIQGNTVNSNFSMTVEDLSSSSEWAMTIHNFNTLNGTWVNQNGSNGLSGGPWGVHTSDNLTSDGCFMYQQHNFNTLKEYLSGWGLTHGMQITGYLR